MFISFFFKIFSGKTATVQEVIADIRKEVDEGKIPSFKYIEVNGMALTCPKKVYAAIWSQLTGEKRLADHAASLLEEKFGAKMNEPIVMVVDELGKLAFFSREHQTDSV